MRRFVSLLLLSLLALRCASSGAGEGGPPDSPAAEVRDAATGPAEVGPETVDLAAPELPRSGDVPVGDAGADVPRGDTTFAPDAPADGGSDAPRADVRPDAPAPTDVPADGAPPPDAPSDAPADAGGPPGDTAEEPVVPVAEALVSAPEAGCADCRVLANDRFDGITDVALSQAADFTTEIEGQTYAFRAFARYRSPFPARVTRIFVYTGDGGGALDVTLSTGFPGGHYPCLDEATGADPNTVDRARRVQLSATAGWRVIDVGDIGYESGGFDEFFVLFDQHEEARVGLGPPRTTGVAGDYPMWGGLIADVPGDGVSCFPTTSEFTAADGHPLTWLIRVEVAPTGAEPMPWFVEAAEGPVVGGQVALGDYDGDGDDDLAGSGRLYQNDGAGHFTEVTTAAGLTGLGGQTVFGDFDNDGAPDLLSVGTAVRLFRNTGDCQFDEVTAAAGLFIDANSQGVAWVDIDQDGLLDFYAASYGTLADPELATRDYVFRNNGDGTFRDVTAQLGIPIQYIVYHGRGVAVADYDADGDPDIYVGNYRLNPNQLWQNAGGMAGFRDVGRSAGVAGSQDMGAYGHTIGPSFGDLDGDGWFDLVVPNLAHPRFLDFSDRTWVYVNAGDGTFAGYEPPDRGIAYDETHSHAVLFDPDNDGDLDLYLTAIYEGRRAYLYANDGAGRFFDATHAAGILHLNGWGAAAGDVDQDGDVDLVADRLWRNEQAFGNHFLAVRLTGAARPENPAAGSNRDAIGAEVVVEVAGRTLLRQVEGGTGLGCQNSRLLHFGLGPAERVERLTVRWPSGRTSERLDVEVDGLVELAEPEE